MSTEGKIFHKDDDHHCQIDFDKSFFCCEDMRDLCRADSNVNIHLSGHVIHHEYLENISTDNWITERPPTFSIRYVSPESYDAQATDDIEINFCPFCGGKIEVYDNV